MTKRCKSIKFIHRRSKIKNISSGYKEGSNSKLVEALTHEYYNLLSMVPFSKYIIDYKVVKPITLPVFPGPTIRGLLGWAIKSNACLTIKGNNEEIYDNDSCNRCFARKYCPYINIFELPYKFRKDKLISPPFAVSAPIDVKTHFLPGETLEFSITIFGKYVNYIAFIVESLKIMGRHGFRDGKAVLEKVYYVNPFNREKHVLIDGRSGLLHNLNNPQTKEANKMIDALLSLDSITINFLSPTEIIVDKRNSPLLTFTNLIRLIIRRTNEMARQYGSMDYKEDKKPLLEIYNTRELIEESKSIEISNYDMYDFLIKRNSKSTGLKMYLKGIRGSVTYRGDFSKFIPLLLLGEQMQIGKHSSFGLGEYKILLKGGA